MTTEYRTTLTSPFPRPEPLVQATRDLDRGRISPEEAEASFARAEEEVREVEASLRLDCRTGGHLRWADLFRPFTEIWHGVSVGALTRFFETNTFYRRPVLDSAPRPGRGSLGTWVPGGPDARAILPGPWTFAHLAELRYGDRTAATATRDLARALSAELASLGPRGPRHLQFQEPLLAYAPQETDPTTLVDAYRTIRAAAPGSGLTVWTYFGDGGRSLPVLGRLPVDAIGFDLLELDRAPEATSNGPALGLGVFDARTTTSESPQELARLVRDAVGPSGVATVWLGPSPPLDLLPFDAAVEKLDVLPELREALAS